MLTALMVECPWPMPTHAVKTLVLLKNNIRALLSAQHKDQVGLAQWCGHSKAWINKFLNEPEAEIQLKDLDRVADFFYIATYQLFQPGISRVTERRKGERRTSQERRIGVAGRVASRLQGEVNKFPRLSRRGDYDISALPADIRKLFETADRAAEAWQEKTARGQAASPRKRVAGEPHDRGGPSRPHSKGPE